MEGQKYKCLECPDCPAGSQSSVPCGSSVPYGTPIHCIPCQLGKTYSDKYGKLQCEACTVCAKGKAVKKNCTLFSNTECDDKCAEGYYPAPFIFECLICTECCNDGNDEMAKECAKFGNKCKVRSVPCTKRPAKSSETAPTSQKLLSMHITETSTTFQTTQWRLPIKRTTRLRKHFPKTSTSPLLTTAWSGNNSQVEEDKTGERNSENKTLIILTTVLSLIAMLSILGLIAFQIVQRKRTNLHSNDVARIEPLSQLGRAASASEEQLNPANMNLETLEKDHQELFDWVCQRLDNGRRLFRRDYERLAAKYEKISLEERNSLRDELLRGRSPSYMLMKLLQIKYPNLTLNCFVRNLNEIGCNDITQKLTPSWQ